jgi:hypothetical protein
MVVIATAKHISEFRPGKERCGCGMRPQKALPILLHKRKQVGFLLRIQIDFAMPQKEDGIHSAEAWTAAGGLPVRH